MARPGFSLDRKFKRLARALDDVQAGFGEILARGALELLWDSAYEACDDYLGDSEDVEALAHWGGKGGTLTDALLAAGGAGCAGFIEAGGSELWPEGKPGTYRVHDLYDHAPDYVQKRLAREAQREAKGQTIADIRRAAGKKGAAVTHRSKRQANGGLASGNHLANGGQREASGWQITRTPSPAPAPAPEEDLAPSPSDSTPPAAEAHDPDPEAEQLTTAARHETASGPTPNPVKTAETPRDPADASVLPGPRGAAGDESPGPEDAPVESGAAEANAAAPGGSDPAARDGGDASLPGIGGKPGAPGPARPADLSPVVAVLPCTGTGPREYAVTEAQVAKWQSAFPGVSVQAELPKMLVWLEANPTKVKTHRGMPAFCVRWLGKAQDDQRGGARPAPAPSRRHGMLPMGTDRVTKPF